MNKIIFVGILACLLSLQNAFAQITREELIGTWGLVGFDMKAQNKSDILTEQEIQTVNMMRKALKEKPKFMRLTFQADGNFISEPNAYKDKGQAKWELKDGIVIIKVNNKVTERHYARIGFNGWLELKAVKSKVALPVMSFEKD
jgi:hypothetical protein